MFDHPELEIAGVARESLAKFERELSLTKIQFEYLIDFLCASGRSGVL